MLLQLIAAALGGGTLGAVGVALVKRGQAHDAAEMVDSAKIRDELWKRVALLEARCDQQAEAMREMVCELARYKSRYASSEARVAELEREVVELRIRLDPPTCA